MNSSSRFPNRKALKLARAALILAAATLVASCVTPKPPQSEDMKLLKDSTTKLCAKKVVNEKSPTPRKQQAQPEAWEPCVNYQPGLVQSDLAKQGKSEDVLIVAALSGGGKRSAAFAYGVFHALNQFSINLPKERVSDRVAEYTTRYLLEEVDLISAVSGGAMTASYYALHHNNTFLPEKNASCGYESFLYEDTGAKIWGLYLFPWKWGWIMDSSYGSNDVMAKFFSERLFGLPAEQQYQPKKVGELPTAEEEKVDLSGYCGKPSDERPNGAIYADLYDQGPPYLLLSSTDLTRGLTFPYTQDGFDLICSDISEFPLGWALAGTNAFPVVLSTVDLRNNHAGTKDEDACSPKRNTELTNVFKNHVACVPLETVLDESSVPTVGANNQFFRSNTLLKTAMTCYARPGDAAYVHLADGGMADNFGLKGITDWFHTHKWSSNFWFLVHTTKRAQLLIIDGQRDVDPKIAREPQGPDVLDAVGTMISNSVDQSNISSFAETRDLFDTLSSYLAMRDFVIFDEWQKEKYADQYDAADLKQFASFLDELEKSSSFDITRGRVNVPFDNRFHQYVANIRKWYAGSTDPKTSESERWSKFAPIWRGMAIIRVANLYGASGVSDDWDSVDVQKVLRTVLHGIDTTKLVGIDEFLKADTLLRGKLERIKEFHKRKVTVMKDDKPLIIDGKPVLNRVPNHWVEISKISVVDDCNTHRRKLLMSSDTGMGLEKDIIFNAIEAGKEVANRHAESVLNFLNTGERRLPTSCEVWVGGKAATSGGETADPMPKQ